MGFLFKKKEVPSELPTLAVDGATNSVEKRGFVNEQKKMYPPLQSSLPQQPVAMQPPEVQSARALQDYQYKQKDQDEQGYFKDLIKSVIEGSDDVNELDSWYKNKFLQEDVVFHMREYWQKQQPQLLLKNVSGELKSRLMDKTDKLHTLEKEWQEVYFNLLAKEEQIRKEEKELKEALSEFMNIVKQTKDRK